MRRSLKRFLSKPWVRRVVVGLSLAYPVTLLAAALVFRFVGERWWVSGVVMFLPRLAFALPLLVLVPLLFVLGERRVLHAQAVSVLLVLFPLMGFVLPGPAPATSGPVLRLLSFNVNSLFAGPEQVFREIVAHAPDVVLVQESSGEAKFEELFRGRYPFVETSTQFLVASRWPVATTSPERLSYEGRSRSPRFMRHVIRTPAGPVTFYNVHPLSPRESFYELRGNDGFRKELRSGRIFSGSAASVIEANAGLRRLQIETIARLASEESGPVVVAGDLNQPDPSPLTGGTLGELRDAFREGGWGFGYTFPASEFKARRTPKIPWMRLDRVLLRGPIATKRFAVGCEGVSDHRCVIADLARP
ncbi:MAG TPA: endonuclease/exonuclease/phosphatase family protein [Polyangiaceae bacterium]